MKLNPILGKGTGKVGGLVFQVNSGVQIVKEKPEHVSNPSTEAQVAQRAKLKLMSQLAADMKNAIAMKKDGLVSPRNKFIARNIGFAQYGAGTAEVEAARLQITDGSAFISAIGTTSTAAGDVTVKCSQSEFRNYDQVVYNLFRVEDDGQFAFLGQEIVDDPGRDGLFPATVNLPAGEYLVLGYGMKEKETSKGSKYGDYEVNYSASKAELINSKSALLQNYDLSMTSGALFALE